MKYCMDCRHCSAPHCYNPTEYCNHPDARDMVGHRSPAMSARHGVCGTDAVLFEPRPVPPLPNPVETDTQASDEPQYMRRWFRWTGLWSTR